MIMESSSKKVSPLNIEQFLLESRVEFEALFAQMFFFSSLFVFFSAVKKSDCNRLYNWFEPIFVSVVAVDNYSFLM